MKSQQPDNQVNILIAIVLSMAILLGWSYFIGSPQLDAEKARQNAASRPDTPTSKAAPKSDAVAPAAAPNALTPAATREAGIAASPRIAIETPSLRGSIALKGATLDDLSLTKHRETVDPKSPNIVLFSPLYTSGGYFARLGWAASGKATKLPDSETIWTAKTKGPLTPSSPITLEWMNGEGLTFRRIVAVDEDYMFSGN